MFVTYIFYVKYIFVPNPFQRYVCYKCNLRIVYSIIYALQTTSYIT
jgi:hypothetical protein